MRRVKNRLVPLGALEAHYKQIEGLKRGLVNLWKAVIKLQDEVKKK